jgi:hypothetical protein
MSESFESGTSNKVLGAADKKPARDSFFFFLSHVKLWLESSC